LSYIAITATYNPSHLLILLVLSLPYRGLDSVLWAGLWNSNGDPMKIKTWNALASALLCILAAMVVSGCEKKNAGGVAAPGLEDTKAIAEQGFIYGLPIAMNYAVMNEYAVDKNNSQYKAPFNQITNEHRVLTYEDTAVVTPNSDRPYSMVWLDLHAEPIGAGRSYGCSDG
jgi:hypothetical protein